MKRFVACLVVACVVGFALVGCSGTKTQTTTPSTTGSTTDASSSVKVPPVDSSKITSGAYETGAKKGGGPATVDKANQIKVGMALADVEKVMGQPGKKLGEVTVQGITGSMYVWYGEKPNTSLIVQLTNGKVSSKSIEGLK